MIVHRVYWRETKNGLKLVHKVARGEEYLVAFIDFDWIPMQLRYADSCTAGIPIARPHLSFGSTFGNTTLSRHFATSAEARAWIDWWASHDLSQRIVLREGETLSIDLGPPRPLPGVKS